INGCLEELKTALADSRKHSQDLQQLLDSQQQCDSSPGNSGSRRVDPKQQYLVSGMSLMINEADLKLAVSYGSVGNGDPNMRSMINKIMESVYTREFMATHSYTGKKAPANRRDTEHRPKPALPIDDVKAIRLFVTSYWSRKHKVTLNPKLITMAIQDKLGTEHREYRRITRMLQNQTASYNALEQDNAPDDGH
ncbi:Uncharacterized protein APZ42_002366, partial [Daphnia magna]